MTKSVGQRLEEYTIKRPEEVLLITLEIDGELDSIVIFKGFSSSLMRPTAFDPDIPVLPQDAKIITIDRIASPYDRDSPRYIQRSMSWEAMAQLLSQMNI